MRTIAIITKNQCSFERMEELAMPLLYQEHSPEERHRLRKIIDDYIWSIVEPYVTFLDTIDEDLMEVVCKQATACFPDRKLDDFFYHTEGSYSFPKKIMEFVHVQPTWKEYTTGIENMNKLGCLLSLKHHIVENTCVILGNQYDLTAPRFTTIGSVTKEDIIRIVRRRFFFTAVLIKENSLTKYYYQNPAYLVSKVFNLSEKDQIDKLPSNLFGYHLLFYFPRENKYTNQMATRINGNYRVYGDILVLHELEENIYANLSIREIKRLNVLSYGRLYDRQPKAEETHTQTIVEPNDKGEEIQKKIIPLWSRYLIIEQRMAQWNKNKNKCINCCQEMAKALLCQSCYRAKYCSESCQKEFNHYHYDECIH